MGKDASLDDFLGTDGSEEREADTNEPDASGGTEPDATTGEADPDDTATGDESAATATDDEPERVAPATTTYAWDGAGAACGACGETVERRWQQDGGLVCGACKDWGRA